MSSPYPLGTTLYRWRFGTVEFDEARRDLRVDGVPVEMENRPLAVLSLLLRHVGEVVTKQELFDQVWAGRVTVDHVLSTAIGKLRKALEAAGEPRIITIPRIGYRFDGPVERVMVGQQVHSELKLAPGQPVPGRPNFLLERLLGRTLGSEAWLARQPRSRNGRVFKFALDGQRLSSIKREATIARVLRDSLGEREDLVHILDWNFESPPFFLECEYAGRSLPEWAQDEERLAAMPHPQRLQLFLQIADTVAAAHEVGVLHKDLKPSNVLVAAREQGWLTRLGDFGSSQLLQPERLAGLGITALGMTASTDSDTSGTPLYLAPELVAGQPATVRSDLYALGVMLYQLLVADLRRPLAPGWERDIDDALLREDIARATDLDPAQRHASVAQLLQRLRSLPQRHAELAQQQAARQEADALRQSLERSRARRPWLLASIAVLAAGLLASALLWRHSEHQRSLANTQATRAETVLGFLRDDLLGAAAPGNFGYERDPTLRQLLVHASDQLEHYPADDPAVLGSLHAAIGQSWRTLGDYERAPEHMRRAVAALDTALGANDAASVRARYALARTLAYAQSPNAFDEARKALEQADAAAGAQRTADTALALDGAVAHGMFHSQQMQNEKALPYWQQADRLQRLLQPDNAYLANSIRYNLADSQRRTGKFAAGERLAQALLNDPLLSAARIGEAAVASNQLLLVRTLRSQGRHAEALPLARAGAATSERVNGADHYLTLTHLSTLASLHDYLEQCPEALVLMRRVHVRMDARYGADSQAALVETGNLGFKEYDCGDREAGLALLRRAESGLREHHGQDNTAAHSFRYGLAKALEAQGRPIEVLALVDGLSVSALTAGDPQPGWQARLDALRGKALMRSGQASAGRPLLASALAQLEQLDGEDAAELEEMRALVGS